MIGLGDNPVQHQTAGASRLVAREQRTATATVLENAVELVAPRSLIETGVAQPRQNKGVIQFGRVERRDHEAHGVISAAATSIRIDLAQTGFRLTPDAAYPAVTREGAYA